VSELQAAESLDRGHEALRKDILSGVADQQVTAADAADGLALTEVLLNLVDDLYSQVDALTTRADLTPTPVTDSLQQPGPDVPLDPQAPR
jgi:hypothetical protein